MGIGILAYPCALVYGAMRQIYALLVYLRKNGYNVEIFDYWPVQL